MTTLLTNGETGIAVEPLDVVFVDATAAASGGGGGELMVLGCHRS